MSTLRKKTGWLVGSVSVALLAGSVMVADAARAEEMSFTIGTSRDLQLGAQIGIAKHKGFFKAEGLDIKVAYFESGAEETSALAAGKLHIGSFGDFPTISMVSSNLPVKILTSVAEISGTQQVVARKGINKPEDLKGKKIGLLVGSSSESLFNTTLGHFGVPLESVEILNMRPPEQIAALARGDIDALTVWQPFVLRAKNKAGGHAMVSALQSFIPGMEGPLSYYAAYSVLVVRNEFLQENPNSIKSVLRALKKAEDYINGNKDDAAKTMEKDMRAPAKDLRVFLDENVYKMGLDAKFVKTLNNTVNFMHSVGKVKSKAKVENFIDDSFLKSVHPELVTYK
jgi:aliphatic sulfonates family ABC transporter substrate-binding protein